MKILFFKEGSKVLTKKKKIFILVGMVALLVVTGCLNLFLSRKQEVVQPTSYTSSSLLATCRVNRREARQQMIDDIERLILASSDAAQIEEMTAAVKKLLAKSETESSLETAIMSAGYEDAVVTINEDDSYSVVVKCNSFSSDDASTILSIMVRETGGLDPNTINIVPV